MKTLAYIFKNNEEWISKQLAGDPDYFKRMAEGQQPDFLWIACSDSRVLPNELAGLGAGEMFVHRNIANLVQYNDINLLSVMQYAVDVLKVKHVVICGHYGCGGVQASLGNTDLGIIDIWIRQIRDLAAKHKQELDAFESETERVNFLVEQNVLQQVKNLTELPVIKKAWEKKQELYVHAWVFDMATGRLIDLKQTEQEQPE
ncbi:carbonic anhydrase [Anseongella ginsenosidimutans]|uniref:Carbonic anhydrase n=1 Tax=Anseongella ginsenosidimutans TaxID=496056 RepID=A0A4R3KS68_9SPHI|nr:carbonic anhydrase [Anseongella ginsenosidimutans]QEC52613.1 carbonic anhydrase [Anseongella ginsenosidimutans]TCS86535.1 carbonic anhydrase [Anseongella ginsenosidimutans]